MYFSRSIIASALLGFAAATTHGEGEQATAIVASETLLATGTTAAALATGTGLLGEAPPAGMVNTHVIQVGGPNGTLEFLPPNIQAKPGDLVQFQFNPKNHSVAESTFGQPCVPIQNVMANKTDAFWSGFMPASLAAGNGTGGGKLTYTIRVKDEKPIWFYCSQGQHCQNGMAGAINAPLTGNRTVEAFQALAANAPENLSPGQSGGGSSTSPSSTPGDTQNPGTEASNTAGGLTPTSTSVDPAQQSVNAAPALSSQSYFGLGLAGLAALFVL
ncbi:hypothetical protein BU24DRAFT_51063 [Aaosphaeria arxii CBS 175.79]|uniref:Cupredoxin n=1 Tax=Aaosphaeria arxii CBS 175.79 TaxID=1450172 RepID=A0A6A5XDR6_9PLEO|nr:uncharacterized protein BU24DRAFT_51063 [Aaosphaeria arxii CBS 175.79]KAF2011013.1 hypothetical protein BU24DRAFT_51063 [Aaosphaeria arxii CBS 175.79]